MRDYKPPTKRGDEPVVNNECFLIVRTDNHTLNQITGPDGGGVLRAGIQLIGWGDGTCVMRLSEPYRETDKAE